MENAKVYIDNAIIEKAEITNDIRGCLTANITFDYGGLVQTEGFCIYQPALQTPAPDFAGHFIWRMLDIAGVDCWEDVRFSPVRVKKVDGQIEAIGHIIKNDWFNPQEEFATMKKNGR